MNARKRSRNTVLDAASVNQPRVLVAGSALIDIVVENFTSIVIGGTVKYSGEICFGGGGANVAYYLAGLGANVGLATIIGRDPLGKALASHLEEAKVRILGKEIKRGETGIVIALSHPWKERSFIVLPESIPELIGIARALNEWEPNVLFIHGYWLSYRHKRIDNEILEALKIAKTMGITIVLDLASYDIIMSRRDFIDPIIKDYVDIVLANYDEALALAAASSKYSYNDLAKLLLRSLELSSVKKIIVKLGRDGAMLIDSTNSTYFIEPSYKPLRLVNSIGAGDAFDATIVYAVSLGISGRSMLKAANMLAAKVLECKCAQCAEAYNEAKSISRIIRANGFKRS